MELGLDDEPDFPDLMSLVVETHATS